MNSVKSLWAMIQGDPKFMRRVNGWFTMFWIVMIPVSFSLHWLSSVTYVSAFHFGHWFPGIGLPGKLPELKLSKKE